MQDAQRVCNRDFVGVSNSRLSEAILCAVRINMIEFINEYMTNTGTPKVGDVLSMRVFDVDSGDSQTEGRRVIAERDLSKGNPREAIINLDPEETPPQEGQSVRVEITEFEGSGYLCKGKFADSTGQDTEDTGQDIEAVENRIGGGPSDGCRGDKNDLLNGHL